MQGVLSRQAASLAVVALLCLAYVWMFRYEVVPISSEKHTATYRLNRWIGSAHLLYWTQIYAMTAYQPKKVEPKKEVKELRLLVNELADELINEQRK